MILLQNFLLEFLLNLCENFFEKLPSLPVMSEKEDVPYINLQVDNSLGGLEWDNLKVEIKRMGYGINVTVPTK